MRKKTLIATVAAIGDGLVSQLGNAIFCSGNCKNKIRLRHVLFLLLVSVVMSFAGPASATIYECQTKQAVVWKHGKLGPEGKVRHSLLNSLIRFDDKTNTMWTGYAPNGPFAPTKMDVVQQGPDDHWDLVALKVGNVNGQFTGFSALRIRAWDKKAGLIFLYTSEETILSGRCETIS